jgi:hypothetical protein
VPFVKDPTLESLNDAVRRARDVGEGFEVKTTATPYGHHDRVAHEVYRGGKYVGVARRTSSGWESVHHEPDAEFATHVDHKTKASAIAHLKRVHRETIGESIDEAKVHLEPAENPFQHGSEAHHVFHKRRRVGTIYQRHYGPTEMWTSVHHEDEGRNRNMTHGHSSKGAAIKALVHEEAEVDEAFRGRRPLLLAIAKVAADKMKDEVDDRTAGTFSKLRAAITPKKGH